MTNSDHITNQEWDSLIQHTAGQVPEDHQPGSSAECGGLHSHLERIERKLDATMTMSDSHSVQLRQLRQHAGLAKS